MNPARRSSRTVQVGSLAVYLLLLAGGCSNHGGSTPQDAAGASPEEDELLCFIKVESTTVAEAPYRLEGWSEYQFEKIPRKTTYGVVVESERPALRAHSEAGASALRRKVTIDPVEKSVVTWCWKVAGSLENADCAKKSSDDCAARLMLLYRYVPDRVGLLERAQFESAKTIGGEYPPFAMLVYAWTESARKEEWITSPYSDRVKVFPIRRGSAKAGQWITETRHHLEDFRKAFGMEPTPIEAVAFMVDTDNTGTEATAWLSSLKFR